MDIKQPDINLQYLGYVNTPLLWEHTPLLDLVQFKIKQIDSLDYNLIPSKKYRLGHLVEQFVFHELEQQKALKLLAKNVQIKNKKQTIGELDCILKTDDSLIHLEIIYKFYLYDESVRYSELEHWIGPNRKDSFIEKITKLKQKQLPLLFKPETQVLLDKLNIKVPNIQQQVYFKAQLFVPFELLNTTLRLINNDCVVGYYLNHKALDTLQDFQFYIPQKLDWLTDPYVDVNWLNYEEGQQEIMAFISQEKSPLCWIKSSDNTLKKLFIVWW
jgi:hypothetical protein